MVDEGMLEYWRDGYLMTEQGRTLLTLHAVMNS